MARDVARGMEYLSAIGFVHRVSYHCMDSAQYTCMESILMKFNLQELAACNILVSRNESCKVSGFGWTRKAEDDIYRVHTVSPLPPPPPNPLPSIYILYISVDFLADAFEFKLAYKHNIRHYWVHFVIISYTLL